MREGGAVANRNGAPFNARRWSGLLDRERAYHAGFGVARDRTDKVVRAGLRVSRDLHRRGGPGLDVDLDPKRIRGEIVQRGPGIRDLDRTADGGCHGDARARLVRGPPPDVKGFELNIAARGRRAGRRSGGRATLGRGRCRSLLARGRNLRALRHLIGGDQVPERPDPVRRALPVAAFARGEVDLAGFVVAAAGHEQRRVEQLFHLPGAVIAGCDTPDPSLTVVRVEVDALQRRELLPAVDRATHDRATTGRLVVRVLGHGQHADLRALGHGGRETVRALQELPTVVPPAAAAGGLHIDLLPEVLPDIADPEVAGLAVERERPRIAQTPVPDLRHR